MTRKRDTLFYLLLLLPLLLLLVFVEIIPLISMIVKSFIQEETGLIGLYNFKEIFANKFYAMSISNSIGLSIKSSIIGIAIALFGASSLHNLQGKWKTTFLKILNMTSNFAGVPLAFSFMILLGNTGFFVLVGKKFGVDYLANFNLYSTSGMLLTYIYFQIPLATLLLYPSFTSIKKEYREAAELLHTSTFNFWRYIAIPILLPSIMGTFSVLFANSIAAYATAHALIGRNYALLPIRISMMFVGDIVQRQEMGSALSLVLMMLMGIITFSTNLISKMMKRGE